MLHVFVILVLFENEDYELVVSYLYVTTVNLLLSSYRLQVLYIISGQILIQSSLFKMLCYNSNSYMSEVFISSLNSGSGGK